MHFEIVTILEILLLWSTIAINGDTDTSCSTLMGGIQANCNSTMTKDCFCKTIRQNCPLPDFCGGDNKNPDVCDYDDAMGDCEDISCTKDSSDGKPLDIKIRCKDLHSGKFLCKVYCNFSTTPPKEDKDSMDSTTVTTISSTKSTPLPLSSTTSTTSLKNSSKNDTPSVVTSSGSTASSSDSTKSDAESTASMHKNGIIIGVSVGGLLIISLVAIVAILIIRRARRKTKGGNRHTNDYQFMPSEGTAPRVADYDNAVNVSPAEQLEPGANLNDHTSGEPGNITARGTSQGYDVIRFDEYSEIPPSHSPVVSSLASAPPVVSGDTILLDNQLYGDNAFKAPSSAVPSAGETFVIDNQLYGK